MDNFRNLVGSAPDSRCICAKWLAVFLVSPRPSSDGGFPVVRHRQRVRARLFPPAQPVSALRPGAALRRGRCHPLLCMCVALRCSVSKLAVHHKGGKDCWAALPPALAAQLLDQRVPTPLVLRLTAAGIGSEYLAPIDGSHRMTYWLSDCIALADVALASWLHR